MSCDHVEHHSLPASPPILPFLLTLPVCLSVIRLSVLGYALVLQLYLSV